MTNEERWAGVDAYVTDRLVGPDPALEAAREHSAASGLPPHEVSPPQGKLLWLLARAIGARSALELGTLGGYSTIWLAMGLPPDGRVVTLEANAAYARVARENIAAAGLQDRVELVEGDALETLPRLAGPFDLVFLDADKERNPEYLEAIRPLTRAGSLIVADNVVREGALADPVSADPKVQALRRFHDAVAADPGLEATTIQTVGAKGHDGFTLVLVTG